MAKWSLDLKKYANKNKVKINEIRRNFAFLLYSSIVKKTPVDTGRARGNWNISIGKDDLSVTHDKKVKFKTKQEVPLATKDESIYIVNNIDYITKLEYGGYPNPAKTGNKTVNGYSKKAPNGMVGVTLANVEKFFDQATKES